ncbi:FG-GAP repeat domain-containing protein [Desulfospira joergensenii]|uniref:FG-GAP repeat domain-containing protein n=1 Tax=Desulfospira joergensenii TaxID=53329 RepID=UPI001ABF442A|nr:VCBS repeat-containing protein [Desulfospira joergensenii]
MKATWLRFNVLILAVLFSFLLSASAWAEVKKFMVTPIRITSQEDLGFLEKGILRMLEARLNIPDHASVVKSSEPADYIVEGSVLIFGDQVNTEIKLINAASKELEIGFNEVGTQKGDVLKHIDLFTENVRTQVLGIAPASGLKSPVQQGGYQQVYQGPRNPEMWRGPALKKEIQSIAVVDIDDDKENETLILSDNELEIYRRTREGFAPLWQGSLDNLDVKHLFVDVMDLDNDGQKEIFITGVHEKNLIPASFIYHYDASGLTKIAGYLKYFLRVVDTKDGPVLLGQKTQGKDERMLNTTVYRMIMDQTGSGLMTSDISYPFAENVFGMAFGDFMNTGEESTAVLGRDGVISIYSSEGAQVYRGSEEYGGTRAAIDYKGIRYTKDDGMVMDKLYLQQRIFAADLYQEGKTSIVVVKNVDEAMGLLDRTRVYRKGHIESLQWNEIGLISQGRTQTISGYISDYTIADMDNDGKKEIVFSVVDPTKLLEDKRSRILSQSFIVKGVKQTF